MVSAFILPPIPIADKKISLSKLLIVFELIIESAMLACVSTSKTLVLNVPSIARGLKGVSVLIPTRLFQTSRKIKSVSNARFSSPVCISRLTRLLSSICPVILPTVLDIYRSNTVFIGLIICQNRRVRKQVCWLVQQFQIIDRHLLPKGYLDFLYRYLEDFELTYN